MPNDGLWYRVNAVLCECQCEFCNDVCSQATCALAERAAVLASAIVASGTKPGGRVGIYAPNCPNWMLIIQACNRSSSYVGESL